MLHLHFADQSDLMNECNFFLVEFFIQFVCLEIIQEIDFFLLFFVFDN